MGLKTQHSLFTKTVENPSSLVSSHTLLISTESDICLHYPFRVLCISRKRNTFRFVDAFCFGCLKDNHDYNYVHGRDPDTKMVVSSDECLFHIF